MVSIEKWKNQEKIKISSLRHRGNAIAVAAELKMDLAYVKREIEKLRGRDEHDVSTKIASTLMAHLFEGYESRMHYLMEMINSLDGRHQINVSDCHQHTIGMTETGPVCLRCSAACRVITLDQQAIYELKQKLLEQHREEDKTLVDFAEKMGYTEKQEGPAPVKFEDNRQIVVMGDQKMVQELSKLDPIERESLRLKFEKAGLEGTNVKT